MGYNVEVTLHILLLLYVAITTTALTLMKLGSTGGAPISIVSERLVFNLNPTLIIAGTLYVLSFLLYTYLISKFNLSYIIAVGTGLVYVVIFIVSFTVFKEIFTVKKVIACALILIGVILMNLDA